jgi:hypothetical protein
MRACVPFLPCGMHFSDEWRLGTVFPSSVAWIAASLQSAQLHVKSRPLPPCQSRLAAEQACAHHHSVEPCADTLCPALCWPHASTTIKGTSPVAFCPCPALFRLPVSRHHHPLFSAARLTMDGPSHRLPLFLHRSGSSTGPRGCSLHRQAYVFFTGELSRRRCAGELAS